MLFKRIITICCIAALVYSCEVNLEPDTRILVSGQVLDEVNQPITQAQVEIASRIATSIFGEDNLILGSGLTDDSGSFNVVSLLERDDEFAVKVNKNQDFTSYTYITDTAANNLDDLEINLGEVSLKRIATVSFNIIETSGAGNTLNFTLKYNDIECVEFFNGEEIDVNNSFCFQQVQISQVLENTVNSTNGIFSTPLLSEIEFTYSINNQAPITETFIVNETSYEFTFNY
ncbi:MAG: hypothetical protein ACWA5P_10215 [bacterium]